MFVSLGFAAVDRMLRIQAQPLHRSIDAGLAAAVLLPPAIGDSVGIRISAAAEPMIASTPGEPKLSRTASVS
jgi:hypothetical protein